MDADAAARPRFKSSVEPIVDADDGLFLLTEGGHHWLPGQLRAELAPLLDGQHTVQAIFERLSERHEPADVLAALDDLQQRHLLADDAADMPRAERTWWERQGINPILVAVLLFAHSGNDDAGRTLIRNAKRF